MKSYIPLEYGDQVVCACNNPECYHVLQVFPNGVWANSDLSDPETNETIGIELPPDVRLCRAHEIPDGHMDDKYLLSLVMGSSEALGPEHGNDPYMVLATSLKALRLVYEEQVVQTRLELEGLRSYQESLKADVSDLLNERSLLQKEIAELRNRNDWFCDEVIRLRKQVGQ